MKKYIFCQVVVLFTIGLTYAQDTDTRSNITCQCNQSSDNSDVLLTIAGKDITSGYFLYMYNKNDKEHKWNLNEYLDLFINFQLKVCDAEEKGIDKTEKFVNELESYKAYGRDSIIFYGPKLESMIHLFYQRNFKLRRAAHIAVKCSQNASGEEVAAAMMKINEARSRVVEYNERFTDVALKYSDDPNVKENKGELGWILMFKYVYSLYDKVYSTPIGQVSSVFRTPFGFHIVLVKEEISNVEVHAAHIMKSLESENAEKEIGDIYLRVSHGGNFEEIAMSQSDDKGSAQRGGDLGYFTHGMMVPEFEDVVFNMSAGEISKPFKTAYGWHIVKFIDSREFKSRTYDEVKKNIRTQILRESELYPVLAASIIDDVRKKCNIASSISDNDVLTYIRKNLAELDSRYAFLCQEYHDGILLFESSLDNVWKNGKTAEEQNRLEKEWLKEMKGKYNLIIHEDAVKRLKKKLNQR